MFQIYISEEIYDRMYDILKPFELTFTHTIGGYLSDRKFFNKLTPITTEILYYSQLHSYAVDFKFTKEGNSNHCFVSLHK